MPTVLITGANRGIGLEFVKQYAADGWKVFACCRHPVEADALKAVKGDVTVYALDVTDRTRMNSLAKEIDEPLGLVIANAGSGGWDIPAFGDFDYGKWADLIDINLFGAVSTVEAFTPHAKKAKGKIAVISSLMGSIADASSSFGVPYRTSKAALNMAMKSLAYELAPQDVALAPFHPGWVQTDMGGADAKITTEESVSGLRKQIAGMKVTDTPRFVDYSGKDLPW